MLWWFAETTLVAAVLGLVAVLVGRFGKLRPAARHALWLVVLIRLMAPPLIRWPVPVPLSWIPAASSRTTPAVEEARSAAPDVRDDLAPRGAPIPVEPLRPAIALPSDLGAWLARGALVSWLAVSAGLAVGQGSRILRFRRRLRSAVSAPYWLVEEARAVGRRLGVKVPEVLVVPTLGVPAVWCLGLPKLLIPERLLDQTGTERWRGILAHELAHLRRGDHWVGRLELLAGLFWWWNPVYWLARRRVDAEAELACDAWVVWAFPDDRLTYAETLFQVCASLSQPQTPAPALGIDGSGRLFERRLTMIVRDQVPCRLSVPCVLGAGLLALLALPSWTTAEPPESADSSETKPAAAADPTSRESDVDGGDDLSFTNKESPPPRIPGDQVRSRPKPGEDGRARIKIDIDLSGIEKALGPDSQLARSLEKLLKDIEAQIGDGSEIETRARELFRKLDQEIPRKLGADSSARNDPEAFAQQLLREREALLKKYTKDLETRVKAKVGEASKQNGGTPSTSGDGPESAGKTGENHAADALSKDSDLREGLRTALGNVALAEAELQRARERLEWATKMNRKGFVSAAQENADKVSVEQKKFALEQAREQLQLQSGNAEASDHQDALRRVKELQQKVRNPNDPALLLARKRLEKYRWRVRDQSPNDKDLASQLASEAKTSRKAIEQRVKELEENLNTLKAELKQLKNEEEKGGK